MTTIKKLFHIQLFQDGRVLVRRLLQAGEKYNPKIHFRAEEVSPLVEKRHEGPYIEISTDDAPQLLGILHNGFFMKGITVPGEDKPRRWKSFFAFWRSNSRQGMKGKAFLNLVDNPIRDMRGIGLATQMDTLNDCPKVGKYGNSITSAPTPANMYMFGDEDTFVDEGNGRELVTYKLENGEDFKIRYIPLKGMNAEEKALLDGFHGISVEGARKLGLKDEAGLGDMWRVRFSTSHGYIKGHMGCLPQLRDVDLVAYGAKQILLDQGFYFMSMGPLHAGVPRTDPQAFINFGYHRVMDGTGEMKNSLAVKLGRKVMHQIWAASKDDAKLRELFLRMTRDSETGEVVLDLEGWMAKRALAYGMSPNRFPFLKRRMVRHLLFTVMDLERCRIPMDDVAKYGYVAPDPYIFDSNGDIRLEWSRIDKEEIVFPAIPAGTEVVCHRQPSENSNAHRFFNVVYQDTYEGFKHKGICLIGRGADEVLGRLGGGDMDDMFLIIHDPEWVKAFETLPHYPETEKLSAEIASDPHSDLIDEQEEDILGLDLPKRDLTHYTNRHAIYQIQKAMSGGAGIGPVVNMQMIDHLESDPENKQFMINNLIKRAENYRKIDEKIADMLDARTIWLMDKPDFEARVLATNQELIIDGNVKDVRLLEQLGDVSAQVQQFHDTRQVYPTCMEGRIPMKKREKGDFVLADSLVCVAIKYLVDMRGKLEDHFKQEEWLMVGPYDAEINATYPPREVIRKQVRGIKQVWNALWAEAFDKGTASDPNTRLGIEGLVAEEVAGLDDEYMEELAIELYRQTYVRLQADAEVDARTGSRRAYPDGLLGSQTFVHHLINAFRKAGWTGAYVPVDLDPFWHGLLHEKLQVQVKGSLVFKCGVDGEGKVYTGPAIGTVTHVPEGVYWMQGGLIEWKQAHEALLPYQELGM